MVSIRSARSARLVSSSPPAGPPRLLYVLIVIMSAPRSSGFGQTRPANIPHACAASNSTAAPTVSAIARTSATGCGNRLRLAPIVINFGRTLFGEFSEAVEIDGEPTSVDRALVDVEPVQPSRSSLVGE